MLSRCRNRVCLIKIWYQAGRGEEKVPLKLKWLMLFANKEHLWHLHWLNVGDALFKLIKYLKTICWTDSKLNSATYFEICWKLLWDTVGMLGPSSRTQSVSFRSCIDAIFERWKGRQFPLPTLNLISHSTAFQCNHLPLVFLSFSHLKLDKS